MNTTTLNTALKLYRPWPLRLLDGLAAVSLGTVRAARAAWERYRDERIARQAIESALELPEETLRDMGAPLWLQVQARARRESARFDSELTRVREQLGSRGYY